MNWLTLVFKYLPTVVQGVIAVEGAIGAGNGASKKQVVLDAITAGAKVGEAVPEVHVSGISALIDTVVAALNATKFGGFAK